MDYFPNIIGQPIAKERLSMYVDAHLNGYPLPNIMFVGPGGVGKTHIARQLAKGLNRSLVEIKGTAIKSKKQIIEQALIPIQGKEVTIFFDEAGEVDTDITNMFLPILEKQQSRRTDFTAPDGTVLTFDFHIQNFIFGTTDAHKLSRPLRTRLNEVCLEDYTDSELIQILKLNTTKVNLEDEALEELVKYSRGDGRWAFSMAEGIEIFLCSKGEQVFRKDHVPQFNRINGIYAEGLTLDEVKLLKVLRDYPISVTAKILQGRMKLNLKALQDLERYPESKGLMQIDSKRKLTNLGQEYLKRIGV